MILCFMRKSKEDRAGTFSVALRERSTGVENDIKHRNFHLNMKTFSPFFLSESDRTLEQISQRDCGISISGNI